MRSLTYCLHISLWKKQWFSFCLRIMFMPFFICLLACCHNTKISLKGKNNSYLLPECLPNKYFPLVGVSTISVWNLLLSRGTQMNLCNTYHNVCIFRDKKTFKHSYLSNQWFSQAKVTRTRIVLGERQGRVLAKSLLHRSCDFP